LRRATNGPLFFMKTVIQIERRKGNA